MKNNAYPQELSLKEKELIELRRSKNKVSKYKNNVGVCLSGGGIRSATLSLGIFQSFAKNNITKYIDYLSSVSGGGYFSSFFCSLFCRKKDVTEVEDSLKNSSYEVNYLRDNSSYLAPNGNRDWLKGSSVLFRNWISVVTVLATLFFAIFTAINFVINIVPIPHTIEIYNFYISSFIYVPAFILLFSVIPLTCSYWLVNIAKSGYMWIWTSLFSILFFNILSFYFSFTSPVIFNFINIIVGSSVFWFILSKVSSGKRSINSNKSNQSNLLDVWLNKSLFVFISFLAISFIMSFGLNLYTAVFGIGFITIGAIFTFATGIIASSKKLIHLSISEDKSFIMQVISKVVMTIIIIGFIFFILVLIASGSYFMSFYYSGNNIENITKSSSDIISKNNIYMFLVFIFFTIVSLSWGKSWSFVNRSSYHVFFKDKLVQTYLGASNEFRKNNNYPINHVHKDDDMPFEKYNAIDNGGPFHIINVTVNETVNGRSKLQQTHRKGMNMAITPAGISVAKRHHSLWDENKKSLTPVYETDIDWKVFDNYGKDINPEKLNLGNWIALSAAAISTGLGNRTSLFTSMVLGLLNFRLGYWWDSGVRGKIKKIPFETQLSFFKEYTASFYGTSRRRWYITDGGHFENHGAYELIRRKLPVIVMCDFGDDPKANFDSLGKLIRKCRTDFQANIRFLSNQEMESILHGDVRKYFGELHDFEKGNDFFKRIKGELYKNNILEKINLDFRENEYSKCYASLAEVTYDDSNDRSIIIYIRSSMIGEEDKDIIQYYNSNPRFPHESTVDQIFGEDQFESYRKLGEIMADKVFQNTKTHKNNTPYEWIVTGVLPEIKNENN